MTETNPERFEARVREPVVPAGSEVDSPKGKSPKVRSKIKSRSPASRKHPSERTSNKQRTPGSTAVPTPQEHPSVELDADPAQVDQDEFDRTLSAALANASPTKFEEFIRAMESLRMTQDTGGSKKPRVQ